jgi:hypothetical protein
MPLRRWVARRQREHEIRRQRAIDKAQQNKRSGIAVANEVGARHAADPGHRHDPTSLVI